MSRSSNKTSLPILPQVQINTPCHADWDTMDGDSQKRFCGSCQKHVHDLSKMDSESAIDLLSKRDGKVCVRVRHNADGSVVTKDNDLSRRGWLSKYGTAAAGLMAMFLFGGCRDPSVQGEFMGDAMITGEPSPVAVPDQPPVMMGKPSSQENIGENDVADNADDLTKALTENEWKLASPGFAFELESTVDYKILPFNRQQAEFWMGFGRFVKFKEGKFEAYNATQCGNDVSVTVTGTYESVGGNKIQIFVEHIERNEYCTKKSESPKKSYGVYSLSRKEDGMLQVTKD